MRCLIAADKARVLGTKDPFAFGAGLNADPVERMQETTHKIINMIGIL